MSTINTTPDEDVNDDHIEGRWHCTIDDCGQPVEANPTLYLSLQEDGSWFIEGVGDESARVTCQNGHDQGSEILEKSMTAFLEETFPGGTWQGSAPRKD